MGCCLLVLLALTGPRVVLFLLWLFTTYVTRAFPGGFLVPLLGFIFLPLTTLAYVYVTDSGVGFGTLGVVLMVVAFLFDVGILGGGRYARQRRRSE